MNPDMDLNIDWQAYDAARARLAGDFIRQFGYLVEDGPLAVRQVEDALRIGSAAAMIMPAERLAEEAEMFGAMGLARLSGTIADLADRCVRHRYRPDELLSYVVRLRPLFFASIARLERETSPLVTRPRKAEKMALDRPNLV